SHCFEMCSQSVTAMYWNPLAVRDCDALKCVRASRASTWYVARFRDARQWNSLVNTELSPNFGDGRSRSGGGGCGLTVGRLGDDLDPVVECHTESEFWQLVG